MKVFKRQIEGLGRRLEDTTTGGFVLWESLRRLACVVVGISFDKYEMMVLFLELVAWQYETFLYL